MGGAQCRKTGGAQLCCEGPTSTGRCKSVVSDCAPPNERSPVSVEAARSPTGKVHFQLPEGSVLSPGQLIARLELDDPAAVRR